jgi:hypothetical protein
VPSTKRACRNGASRAAEEEKASGASAEDVDGARASRQADGPQLFAAFTSAFEELDLIPSVQGHGETGEFLDVRFSKSF